MKRNRNEFPWNKILWKTVFQSKLCDFLRNNSTCCDWKAFCFISIKVLWRFFLSLIVLFISNRQCVWLVDFTPTWSSSSITKLARQEQSRKKKIVAACHSATLLTCTSYLMCSIKSTYARCKMFDVHIDHVSRLPAIYCNGNEK